MSHNQIYIRPSVYKCFYQVHYISTYILMYILSTQLLVTKWQQTLVKSVMKSHSNVSRHYKLEISNHPLQSALNILFLKVEPLKIKVKTIHFKVENIRFPFLQATMQRTRISEAGSTTNQSQYSSSCTVIGLSHSGVLLEWKPNFLDLKVKNVQI